MCHFGTSSAIFPMLNLKNDDEIVFFLDGHFSGGITYFSDIETPILEELEFIKKIAGQTKKIVVLIDDVRCFKTNEFQVSKYPSLNRLVDFARNMHWVWKIESDMFIMSSVSF